LPYWAEILSSYVRVAFYFKDTSTRENENKMRHFRITNFDKYQPKRKGKTAPWIRLYASWNNDWAIGQLSDSHKAHFTGLLLVAHATNNQIPWDTKWLKTQIQARSNVKIEVFEKLGLIEILDNKEFSKEKKLVPEKRGEEKRGEELQSKTQKNSKPKKETLISFYMDEFKRVFKETPDMKYKEDGAILKGLEKTHGTEKVKYMITKLLTSKDSWIATTGRNVKVLKSQVNKLLIGSTGNPNKEGRARI